MEAQRTVGLALLKGTVVPRDVEQGREWLERAIDLGDLEALHQLARHDLLAGKLGRGPRAAWELLLRGADLGDPRSALQVAHGIAHGLFIEDAAEAALYFDRSGLPSERNLAIRLANLALAGGEADAVALLAQLS